MPETETESPLLMDLVPEGHAHRGAVETMADRKTNTVDDLLVRFAGMQDTLARSPGQFPGEDATQEDIRAWGRKAGAPEDTTQYALPQADGVLGSLMEALKDGFAEAGVPAPQALIVAKHFHEIYAGAEKDTAETAAATAEVKDTEWAQQYGAEAANKQIQATSEIQKTFGDGTEPIDRNDPKLKDAMLALARARAPDGMPQHQAHGGAPPSKMTVRQAGQRMEAIVAREDFTPANENYIALTKEFEDLNHFIHGKGYDDYDQALNADD